MIIWLLALLLLSISIYVVYRISLSENTKDEDLQTQNYTFKI